MMVFAGSTSMISSLRRVSSGAIARPSLLRASKTSRRSRFGFGVVASAEIHRLGIDEVGALLRERIGSKPLYISLDIDVLDPAYAPGTGTPEPVVVCAGKPDLLRKLLEGV